MEIVEEAIDMHGTHMKPQGTPAWTEKESERVTVSRQNRYRWYFQVALTLLACLFGISLTMIGVVWATGDWRLTLVTIGTNMFTMFAMLHFNVKKQNKQLK
jgi:hypothetical protein